MKKTGILLFALLISGIISAQTGKVSVTVTGFNVEKGGTVKIGLYNNESDFPITEKTYKGKDIKVDNKVCTYTFENIPTGTYAVAIIHDEDNDGKLNKNLFGAPSESYGFSNNLYGTFGPPDFEEVSFKVESEKVVKLTINVE